jgi:hypothetical protein
MSKLRLHQVFGIAGGKLHRPSAIGVDLCVQPEQQPAASGSQLTAGDCAAKGADFTVMNGHIKHSSSGLCVALLHENATAIVPAVLASCGVATATWSVDRVANQPTFASMADPKLCLDFGSSAAVEPGPATKSGTSAYLEADRLFVIAPRGHLRRGERLTVTAMAFLQKVWNASTETPPELLVRALNHSSATISASTWTVVPMAAIAPGRHVFKAQVPSVISEGDFEYYTRVRELAFPTLGAKSAIAVVVV